MDLVDAQSSNTQTHSVVDLSLAVCFEREYPSLFKAIADMGPQAMKKSLAQLAARCLPLHNSSLFGYCE